MAIKLRERIRNANFLRKCQVKIKDVVSLSINF